MTVQGTSTGTEAVLEKIETIVKLAMSDGEYIGRHQTKMTPHAVIDLRDGATAERLKTVRSILGVAQAAPVPDEWQRRWPGKAWEHMPTDPGNPEQTKDIIRRWENSGCEVRALYAAPQPASNAYDVKERDLSDTALRIGARDRYALWLVLEWWDGLPPSLRQDIEGSGNEPGCIAHARTTLALTSTTRGPAA